VGKQVDIWLQDLHAARFIMLGVGDEDTTASKHGSIEADFQSWRSQLWLRVDKFKTACQCEGSGRDKVLSKFFNSPTVAQANCLKTILKFTLKLTLKQL
jgi:hypothetical protein